MKKPLLFLLLAGALILGASAGWYGRLTYTNSLPGKLVEIRENTGIFKFINPLLLVDTPRQAPEYSDLKKSVEAYISKVQNQHKADSVSVYFRDLNLGKWIGVNEDTTYDPSSMLKVAVMMGYLKEADRNPSVLLQKLPYTPVADPGQHYPPEHPLAPGAYPARELIDKMITESDNDALASLYTADRQSFIDVLRSLAIPPPPTASDLDFVSPKTYSAIFRTLYSSTYLPRVLSEQALQLLSYTKFTNGLVAGVPAGTVVSHKFGEHTTLSNLTLVSHQLHDCGIVYYPGRPYFLCVMTRGADFQNLESIIADISKTVYDAVHGMNI